MNPKYISKYNPYGFEAGDHVLIISNSSASPRRDKDIGKIVRLDLVLSHWCGIIGGSNSNVMVVDIVPAGSKNKNFIRLLKRD